MKKVNCINADRLPGNDIGPRLTKGENYEVVKEYTCKCGQVHYDVGIVSTLNYVECYLCRETLPDSKKIHWCNSIRFVAA